MDERFSFEVIAKVCFLPVYRLEQLRRLAGLQWQPKGYTAEEVRKMLGDSPQLRSPGEIGPRAKKALRLLELLSKA
ncbi:MAG: hypothetical protein J5556_07065 [Deltaproteobacteria bacterium]|nr:hypothetical protein [Deltaproteobacteria bacterium]